jgi:cytochrome b6
MATTLHSALQNLRETKVWKSIFRRGPANTNRTRSLAVFGNLFLHWLPVKVREKSLRVRASYYLGSISFILFIVLFVTGILLMFYYHPAAPHAYRDMKDLQFVVSSGQFLRNMHRWAAHAMVAIVFVHMLRVFYTGSYRPPKEFNWVIGVVLLVMTILLSYTGYLLPWDQLSFWGISVGTNMVRAVPYGLGDGMSFLLLGGNIVGENALVRFYVLHCFIIPVAAMVFMGIHFWRVRKDGGV